MVSAADRYLITDRGREKAVYTIQHILCAADLLWPYNCKNSTYITMGTLKRGAIHNNLQYLNVNVREKNNQREEEKHLENPL